MSNDWRRSLKSKWAGMALLGLLVAVFALVAAGCGGDDEGGGGDTVKIVSDLPLQGSDRVQTEQMVRGSSSCSRRRATRPVTTRSSSSRSTTRPPRPASGTRRSAPRMRRTYAGDDKIVVVIGTYNSGCAGIEIPLLNEALIGDGQPGEHVRRTDALGPGHRAGRARQVLPVGRAQLRARRRLRRLPGQDRRRAS